MKFYFEGKFDPSPRKEGKLAKVVITPDSNNRIRRPLFVLVQGEVEKPIYGSAYNITLVGGQTPMIFLPSKRNHQDKRILVMGNIPQPGHRSFGCIDTEKTTAKILDESSGGGAWGAGSVFLAILEPGQRVVSNSLTVWLNRNGELIKRNYNSLSEYHAFHEIHKIEWL